MKDKRGGVGRGWGERREEKTRSEKLQVRKTSWGGGLLGVRHSGVCMVVVWVIVITDRPSEGDREDCP